MNNEVYRRLDKEEIITKNHYWRCNGKFVLLPSDYSCVGKKVEGSSIYEKISLEDFRILDDNEIVNDEHFYVWRSYEDYCGYLRICRCLSFAGYKVGDVRNEYRHLSEFNLYAKQKMQFNFETLNILKDIEL
jgi:hypothetical protein